MNESLALFLLIMLWPLSFLSLHAQDDLSDYYSQDGLLYLDVSSPSFQDYFKDKTEDLPLHRPQTSPPPEKEALKKLYLVRCSQCGDESQNYYIPYLPQKLSEFMVAWRENQQGLEKESILHLSCGHNFCTSCTPFVDHEDELTFCPQQGCLSPQSKVQKERSFGVLSLSEGHYPGLNVRGWDLRRIRISPKNLKDLDMENTVVDLDLYHEFLLSNLAGENDPINFLVKINEIDKRVTHPDSNSVKSKILLEQLPEMLKKVGERSEILFIKAISFFDPLSSLEDLQRFLSLMEDQELAPDTWGAVQATLLKTRTRPLEKEALIAKIKKSLERLEWNGEEMVEYLRPFSHAQDLYPLLKSFLNKVDRPEDFLLLNRSYINELSQKLKGTREEMERLHHLFRRKGMVLLAPSEREKSLGHLSKSPNQGQHQALSLGRIHSCVITDEGEVRCWGDNGSDRATPPPDLGKAKSIALGGYHSCAITEEDQVKCWGSAESGQTLSPDDLGKVKSIATGEYHSCAITEDNLVKCWGIDKYNVTTIPPNLGKVKSISLGNAHSCALTEKDEVKCWGCAYQNRCFPPRDLGLVKSLATGWNHSCVITSDDEVKCWGVNGMGQATPPHDLGKVKSIALGGQHSCAVTVNDEVKCWGLKDGRIIPPVDLGSVKSIALGGWHSCAVTVDDEIKCWGANGDNQSTPPNDLGKVKGYL